MNGVFSRKDIPLKPFRPKKKMFSGADRKVNVDLIEMKLQLEALRR